MKQKRTSHKMRRARLFILCTSYEYRNRMRRCPAVDIFSSTDKQVKFVVRIFIGIFNKSAKIQSNRKKGKTKKTKQNETKHKKLCQSLNNNAQKSIPNLNSFNVSTSKIQLCSITNVLRNLSHFRNKIYNSKC